MKYENILVATNEKITIITINRPDKLNALNMLTIEELHVALDNLSKDESCKIIIITGSGNKAFVAGADISEFYKFSKDQARDLSFSGQTKLFDFIENYTKPVIAAINGYALGGGLELAMACHVRIASENTLMGLPEVSLGVTPGYGGTQRLPQLVGKGIAMELILSANMINAERGEKVGLLNHITSQENLLSFSADLAKKIISNTTNEIELSVDDQPKKESLNTTALDLIIEAEKTEIEAVKPESLALEVNAIQTEEKVADQSENYDPTLDLPRYQYPTIDLLIEYPVKDVKVSKEELESNKDNILSTLINFKIAISSIKATIGPTVTLYEIVPEAGVKISKIKNLEDDIALSLSALGIRIIAPIPGKGTIGIEVPNKNREMVSAKSVITTEKFLKSDYELPIVLGKTISNEVFVTDLSKMPHLLMAGATGQGKSVGLNIILASLIYKKHPSQLKFVLVDPKKVELTLFNKIEKHFLAKLPETDEAIITDTTKVVNTLNSLCIEMDARYDLLKDAGCRNLKEYNKKFINRRLNPKKGHKYLPYIVLVIDELADLMMTAGKEVEMPIARLAQLARAIGIHLIVATQRPSVNVITGIIKANFPARLSFRVTSKIDSRTILDTGGAEQLVGMGDMLLSLGSDMIRLQCAFLDTPEVENICDFIGEQQGYDSAYMLPEYLGEENSSSGTIDLSDKDVMFDDAARLIVSHQQGSTSLIQRKMKLGYNRAGRIIDQLEATGIVGPFEGSKAREVLISDEYSLEQKLTELNK